MGLFIYFFCSIIIYKGEGTYYDFIPKKIKNPIIRINAGTLSNMNENTKEIYH